MMLIIEDTEAQDLLLILKDHPDLAELADRIRANLAPPSVSVKAPSGFRLGATSRQRMKGIHAELIRVLERAIEITPQDFTVLEGLRSKDRQRQLVAKGASKTMHSRHLTGHAVDIAPLVNGQVSWDWKHYGPLAKAMKQAALECGVKVEWGGDWQSFKDGPHWQLPA